MWHTSLSFSLAGMILGEKNNNIQFFVLKQKEKHNARSYRNKKMFKIVFYVHFQNLKSSTLIQADVSKQIQLQPSC